MSAEPRLVPSFRFSRTVSWKNSERSSGTWATPSRGSLNAFLPAIDVPKSLMSPPRIEFRRDTASSVVVLPAPFGPSRATTSPSSTWRLRPRTTGTPK